jgi:hypothetical protein
MLAKPLRVGFQRMLGHPAVMLATQRYKVRRVCDGPSARTAYDFVGVISPAEALSDSAALKLTEHVTLGFHSVRYLPPFPKQDTPLA